MDSHCGSARMKLGVWRASSKVGNLLITPRKWHTLNRRILHSSPSLHVTLASSACCPWSMGIPWPWPEARALSSPMVLGGAVGWSEGWDEVQVEDDGRSIDCATHYAEPFANGISFHSHSTFGKSVLSHGGRNWGSEKTPSASLGDMRKGLKGKWFPIRTSWLWNIKSKTDTDNNAHTFLSLQLHPPYP